MASDSTMDRIKEMYFASGWAAAINDVVDAQANNRLDEFLFSQRHVFRKATQ